MRPDLMIVDDATDQIYLMQMLLKTIMPELITISAANGDEALKILNDAVLTPPKVILLDLKLAGKTGLEVLSEIKKSQKLKRIPVCLFSNSDLKADVYEAYELGANFYFKKPVGLAELKKFTEHFVNLWFRYASFCAE